MLRERPTDCCSLTLVLEAATLNLRCATRRARRLVGRLVLAVLLVLLGLLIAFSRPEASRPTDSQAPERRFGSGLSVLGYAREFRVVVVDGIYDAVKTRRQSRDREKFPMNLLTPRSPGPGADRIALVGVKTAEGPQAAAASAAVAGGTTTAAASTADASATGAATAYVANVTASNASFTTYNDSLLSPDIKARDVVSGSATFTPERFMLLDSKMEQFVYSAHFDDRTSVVHIVGFKHRYAAEAARPLWCRYSFGESDDETLHRMEVHFNLSVFQPKPGLLYNTFVWRCAVDHGSSRRPLYVSLVGEGDGAPVATLRVQYTPPSGPSEAVQFGVCVKPMANYSNLYQLVEFVEVHRLFGVSKFIIYDHSHSISIDAALSYYIATGLVIVHRWPLPVPLEAVHAKGQKSTNHHCLMTYMNVFKYIAFIDLDEILVPIAPARSWTDIITAAKASSGSKQTDGAYVFLSSIFPKEIANYSGLDCVSPTQPCKMATLVNRIRSDVYPVGSWSKPLVETRKTDLVDIHDVRRMLSNYTVLEVNPSIAFIHHYRAEVQLSGGLTDRGIEQFREDIILKVGAMFSKFSPRSTNAT